MSHQIYLMVTEALNNHPLDCSCRICEAFANAGDGSRGHAAACEAAYKILYPETQGETR